MIVSALVISGLAGLGTTEATRVFVAQRPAARARLLTNAVLAGAGGALVMGGLAVAALVALEASRPAGVNDLELGAIAAGAFVGALALAGAAYLQRAAAASARTRGCWPPVPGSTRC